MIAIVDKGDQSMTSAVFEPLMELTVPTAEFLSDWSHCDKLSSYVAKQVSHSRRDPHFFANLFSSALNELLETAFRVHDASDGKHGALSCMVSRAGQVERIALRIPCSADEKLFYQAYIDGLCADDLLERYGSALLAENLVDPAIGLLELAVDYHARFQVANDGDSHICLTTDLVLEDAA